ncbi:hypothetical protein AMJ57_04115 [Parcubacteria bacterium SG8_24]|nr:MAG: hypothetical protein AMJ57_04115 [Parcubacteria bacterium SG8_24]
MPPDDLTEEKLSEKELKWGYWWVTHKAQIRRIFSVILGFVAGVLLLYGMYGFVDWFLLSGVQERSSIGLLTRNWTDFGFFRAATAPQDLQVGGTTVLAAGTKRYDLVTQLSNPNERWRAEFDYQFLGAGVATKVKSGHILPLETRLMHELGMESESRPAATLEILDLRWKRVNLHDVQPDYRSWAEARLDIDITDVEFVKPEPVDPLQVSRARFIATNDTAFSYYSVGFTVLLYSGSRMTGANKVTISDFRAGDRREVEASWFHTLPEITRVEVRPEINIFDERLYIPPGR